MLSLKNLFGLSTKSAINSRLIRVIEDNIVNKLDCGINREDKYLVAKILEKHIKLSHFSIKEIESYIKNNRDFIEKFIIEYFKDQNVQTLGVGFTLSYSIYLLYLEKSEKEFLDYLVKRQLPNSQKLLNRLKSIKNKIK